MKRINKKGFNAVLALLIASGLTGCGLFGDKDNEKTKDITDENQQNEHENNSTKDDDKSKEESAETSEEESTVINNEKKLDITKNTTHNGSSQETTRPSKATVNTSELRSLLVECMKMDITSYTPKTCLYFQNEMKYAEKILNTLSATQDEINKEVKLLEIAKNQLTKIADFTKLMEILTEAKNVKIDSYTPTSVDYLKQDIEKAETVYSDKNTSQAEIDRVIETLKTAMNSLTARANFDELLETIKQVEKIKDEDYTDESLSFMYESLAQAKNLKDNMNASQKEVDEANKNLHDTSNKLVAYVAPNKKELTTLIEQAKMLKENEYSISSFKTLKKAITQAEETLSIRKVTEAQVLDAKEKLQTAIDGLDVDLSYLKNELKEAKDINELLYTPSTYQKLKEIINDTDLFLTSTHKQYEIDNQVNIVKNAISNLIKRADKKDLKKVIDDAKSTYSGDYTEATMNTLKSAVSDAEIVYNDLEATQESVSNTTRKLKDAISQLKVVIHKEKLKEIIDKSAYCKEEDYTPTSYILFKNAYDQAILINEDDNATQTQVDECTSLLEKTFDELIQRADFTALNQKIITVEAINQDEYTDASLVNLITELANAKKLAIDLNATQEAIDQQLLALTNAIDNLVNYVKSNFDAINQTIGNVEGIKQEDWSSTSYNTMIEKLNVAKEVINKRKVTQDEINQANNELSDAYNSLTVDLSIINSTLTTAKTYQEKNYTLDTFKVLQDQIKHVEDFLKTSHTQKEVNTENNSLESAVNQLVLFEEENKVALTTAIDNAKALKENDYTPNTYLALTSAITKAEAVKNNYRATAGEINTAINELDSAKANLVKRSNLTQLNKLISDAKEYYSKQYTTASLNALKIVVSESETLITNANVSQNEVDSKTNEIQTAIDNLIQLGDKTTLISLINELEALNENDYTPTSWVSASLGSVISDAKAIKDNSEATDEEVNNALDNLTVAKSLLVKKADMTELSNEIVKAQSELSKGYTSESISALTDAITKAQEVINNQNASATDVSSALTNLKNAISSLRIDVTPLITEINKAKAIDTSNKQPSTVKEFNKVLKEAEDYINSSSITFEGMEQQIQNLKSAVKNLKDKADTSILAKNLTTAQGLDSSKYTQDTYTLLQNEIIKAQQALSNDNISQEDVNAIVSSLTNAMNNLKLIPTVANKRVECEKAIADGYTLLNDTSIQVPAEYRSALQSIVEDADGLLSYYEDNELTIDQIQKYIDGIKTKTQDFNNNRYDMEAMITKCQAKIAEVRSMDTTGFSTNSVYTMNYYADHLEESISEGKNYEYLQSAYGWLLDAIDELAPADTTVYVNNEAPSEVLALLNAERAKLGLTELTMDAKLCEATTIRATEAQYQTGSFTDWAHKRPDGRKWSTVLDEVGYHQSYAGENAASGYGSGSSLYNGWYNSQGHKDNMLDPAFTKVGISMIKVGEGTWVSYMILA